MAEKVKMYQVGALANNHTLRYLVRSWLERVPVLCDAALYQNVTIHGEFWYGGAFR